MLIGCLLALLLALLYAVGEALVLWAVWSLVICAIWPTLPAIGFWMWCAILCAINIIGGFFRTTIRKS